LETHLTTASLSSHKIESDQSQNTVPSNINKPFKLESEPAKHCGKKVMSFNDKLDFTRRLSGYHFQNLNTVSSLYPPDDYLKNDLGLICCVILRY